MQFSKKLKKSIKLFSLDFTSISFIITLILQAFSPSINEYIRAKGWLNFELLTIEKDYCTDYTKKAANGEISDVIGRDDELERVINILSRKGKGNVLLIGEPGVGKTALAQGLAWRIANENVPEDFKNKKLINVDFIGLTAGKNQDINSFQPTQRVRKMLNIAKNDKNKILFIDEFHQVEIIRATELFKTFIDSGNVKVLGATTIDEYNKYIKPNEALDRRFEKIILNELSPELTLEILKNNSESIAKSYDITIHDNILENIVKLTEKYIQNKRFPDKAIDVLNSSAMLAARRKTNRIITEEDILKIVSQDTNIPIDKFDNNTNYINDLKSHLKNKIFGQNEAIDKVCENLNLLRSSFRPKDSTINFLFTGPKSVGKKQLALAIGKEIGNYIEIDMSLFPDPENIKDFIDDNLNHNILFKHIVQNPYSVIILKNIDKTSDDLRNLLIRSFNSGYITSISGKKFNISNEFVIMTTNICMNAFEKPYLCGCSDCTNLKNCISMKNFSKQVGNLVVFNKLNHDDLKNIVNSSINELIENLSSNNIKLTVDDNLKEFFIKSCEKSDYKALEVSKNIVENLVIPVLQKISQQNFKTKKLELICSECDGKIIINVKDFDNNIFSI